MNNILSQVIQGEKNVSSMNDDLPIFSKEESHSLEEKTFEEARYEYLHEQIEDMAHFRKMRKDMANKVYYFLVVWSICLFGLLITQGLWDKFHLNDYILITLCGGTTASTIGLVGFIVKGLFGGK